MEEQLIAAFRGTLEPNVETIKAAEKHLREVLHPLPSAGMALIKIIFANDGSLPISIRQAAAVNLSKWIKERWSPFFAEFEGFQERIGDKVETVALPVEQKPPIREALLSGLALQETKLRGPILKALISIASCDWPDEFPDLLPKVQSLLQAQGQGRESNYAVESALAFLDEWFYSSMDETGLMSITRELFPDLERILSNQDVYSAQIRCHCVSILNQTLETLWMVKEQYPDAAKTVAQDLLPKWLSHLESILRSDPSQIIAAFNQGSNGTFPQRAGEELALQSQAWQTLITATHFGSHFKPRLIALQTQALSSLTSLQGPFQHYHISAADDIEGTKDLTFFATPSNLAAKIIDFFGVVLQKSKDTSNLDVLNTFIPLLCSYSRITTGEEEEWLANVSEFVAAGEDDELGALNNSTRGRCADILGDLMMSKPNEVAVSLQNTVQLSHNKGQDLQNAGQPSWWKEEEACLALIGGVAEYIVEQIEEAKKTSQKPTFDVEGVFGSSVMPYIAKGTPHFLYGRCFVFASQFAGILPTHLATSFLEAAVNVMEDTTSEDEDADAITKLSAVRCVKNFHRHLDDDVVQPYTARILARLAPLLLNASEDVLILIIETLQAVAVQRQANSGANIPAHLYGEMSQAAIKAWAKEAMDRVLQSAIEDLLEAFVGQPSNEAVLSTIQASIPLIADLLRNEVQLTADSAKNRSGIMAEGALDFAVALVRGAKKDTLAQSDIVNSFFPTLFATIEQIEDREVYGSAATVLSTIISKIPEQSLSWQMNGISAVQLILTLVSKMISPYDSSESGGLAVGDLLSTLLRKQPQSVSNELPSLCQALVTRLATSSSTSLVQSLVIPLAFLMKDHLETVLGLLLPYSIADADGTQRPSLEILARKWVDFAANIQGFWHSRVSTIGLCGLFKARTTLPGVAEQLDHINVDGDLLPDDVNIIKTRSRAKMMPDKFTQVPIPAKIIKVLIGEFRQATDGPPKSSAEEEREALSDDENEDWDDDEWDTGTVKEGGGQKRQDFLSDLLGEDLNDDLDALLREHDKEQYGDDPIWSMNFRVSIGKGIKRV
ncbi:hypothetical protein L7F22_019516 [Adiantum nelumboides]|nr:hypothetical protein [Adiantum nelumboides]